MHKSWCSYSMPIAQNTCRTSGTNMTTCCIFHICLPLTIFTWDISFSPFDVPLWRLTAAWRELYMSGTILVTRITTTCSDLTSSPHLFYVHPPFYYGFKLSSTSMTAVKLFFEWTIFVASRKSRGRSPGAQRKFEKGFKDPHQLSPGKLKERA